MYQQAVQVIVLEGRRSGTRSEELIMQKKKTFFYHAKYPRQW